MPQIGLYQTLLHAKLNRPRPAQRKRRLISMLPEKRPQTIMEQYRWREMMSHAPMWQHSPLHWHPPSWKATWLGSRLKSMSLGL